MKSEDAADAVPKAAEAPAPDTEATPDCRAEAAPDVVPTPAPDPAGGPAEAPADPLDLPANVMAVTFDHATKWWTARTGKASANLTATSHRGPVEAMTALLTSLHFSGHGFDPDFRI